MVGIAFCLIVPLLFGSAIVIWAMTIGLRALDASHSLAGEQRRLLRLLALHLLEPVFNTPLIAVLAIIFGGIFSEPIQGNLLAATLPMAILLIPLLGLRSMDQERRRIAQQMTWLGLARWFAVLFCFGALSSGNPSSLAGNMLLIVSAAQLVAILLLAGSIYWGERVIKRLRIETTAPVVVPLQPVAAARPNIPSPIVLPSHTPTKEAEVPCAACGALTLPDTHACTECGLVFQSQIPIRLRQIPRYTLLRPLTAGGMSLVYLARDRSSSKLCVIKAVHSTETVDLQWRVEALQCLEREAALLHKLNHPSIVQELGWYPDDGNFLALEYIEAQSLERLLEQHSKTLTPGRLLRAGAEIADALYYLQQLPHPVVHGDIKPGNLLLPETERAVLIDFGSALMLGSGTYQHSSDRYGTPGYAAPEQYQQLPGFASDIYGLAATLYHGLSGDDPTTHPLAFPAIGKLPSDIVALLSPALAREATQRPTAFTFRQALHDLAKRYR